MWAGYGLGCSRRHLLRARGAGLAAALFALSLVFRTADRAVCPILPIGTHFLWHVLNAAVLALYLEAAARYGAKRPLKKN